MFDGGSRKYDDTEVVELPIARSRVRTEELTMQVMTQGEWHRRLPDLSATSCGSQFHSQFAPVRRETLKHPLCQGCFTPFELARADAAALEEQPDE